MVEKAKSRSLAYHYHKHISICAQHISTPLGEMNEAPPVMHYEATHADGYELEILADLASHQFDDLDKYSHAEPAHASPSWSRTDDHLPTTPGTCNLSHSFCFPTYITYLINWERQESLQSRVGEQTSECRQPRSEAGICFATYYSSPPRLHDRQSLSNFLYRAFDRPSGRRRDAPCRFAISRDTYRRRGQIRRIWIRYI